MKKIYIFVIAAVFSSCSYLDVIPDNITTMEMAFNNRANAIKYLSTCYSYMPMPMDPYTNAGMMCADDMHPYAIQYITLFNFASSWNYVRGNQNISNPYFNLWSGSNMFRGVHECNIFMENIDRVPDMSASEKGRWKAEVLTLKAYYIYWIMLHYGPIPLLKENHATTADFEDIIQYREKIDDVVAYIVELIDEALTFEPGLPERITSISTELGRITRSAAMAIKAKILVVAASPLFNGNEDYANFLDPRDGNPFFNQEKSVAKWEAAAEACRLAIEEAEKFHSLFTFTDKLDFEMTPETQLQMTLRDLIANRNNPEAIFAPGSAGAELQRLAQAHLTTYHVGGQNLDTHKSQLAPTLNVIEEYYTVNGVPIEEDMSTTMSEQYEFKDTPGDQLAYFAPNYTTIQMHFDREPRFYAHIGFDGGKWMMSEADHDSPETAYPINSKKGGLAGFSTFYTSSTGYFAKKLCSYRNVNTSASLVVYAFPNMHIRLADLYLLYSEALNETLSTPNDEVYKYIQMVRHRAGLDVNSTLQDTWRQHSSNPNKPSSQNGMREIIHRERLIELQFEGARFHDLRRWKKAETYFNKGVRGFRPLETDTENFYIQRTIYSRTFKKKDYLWPIMQDDLLRNPKLVQNPGW